MPAPRWRRARRYVALAALLLLLALLALPLARAEEPPALQVPDGFVVEVLAEDMAIPTAFAFLPDGRILIAEQPGIVRVFKDGALLDEPFLDISDHVNFITERGLLGIAVSPTFSTDHYVYLYYSYDGNPADHDGPKTDRLTRVTADGDAAVPGSEVVLLGTVSTPPCESQPAGADCIPADWTEHSGGGLAFAPDGTLYLGIGDGARGHDFPRELRAQNLDLLSGKLLHVTATGEGLPSNPFWNGDPKANRSKVWALGLREPFKVALRPSDGLPFLGDVGSNHWDEVNVASPGRNFGWPCDEGIDPQADLQPVPPECQALADRGPSGQGWPLFSFGPAEENDNSSSETAHKPTAVIGGGFYTGSAFPADYQGAYFFADFHRATVSYLKLDEATHLAGPPTLFAKGRTRLSALAMGPDGALYALAPWDSALLRIRYVGPAGQPPAPPEGVYVASYYPNPTLDGAPFSVRTEWDINHHWSAEDAARWADGGAFSARWQGSFRFRAGAYDFAVAGDDGIRVWLDDELIVDAWGGAVAPDAATRRQIDEGLHRVAVEYHNDGGDGVARLRWMPAPPAD